MGLNLIVAADEQNAIGFGNKMPWHLPVDLKYFKKVTSGHPVIMGRKTFESIGRLLPNRRNIIISRSDFRVEGAETYSSLAAALQQFSNEDEVFIIGGGQIYAQSIDLAKRVYLTRVHTIAADADTHFPVLDKTSWKQVQAERVVADEKNAFAFNILIS
jgi:dihydrofolate reductase